MATLASSTIAVFFTRGMSLDGWRRAGILDRELALYRALRPHVARLMFLSYGDAGDAGVPQAWPDVEVLPNRWGLSSTLYSLLAPWLHREALKRATILKTNQLNGAWAAVIAKRLFHKKLVVRCGFVWSQSFRAGGHTWRRHLSRRIEGWVLRAADRIVVAGEADRRTIARLHGVAPETIDVIPNFVETAIFRRLPDVTPEPRRVTFVGRLAEEKNLGALLEALEGLAGFRLVLIGDGPLRGSLEQMARNRGLDVEFTGTVRQTDLPVWLNRSEAFVLPSHFEGNPKALLEAMACGVPVIGTRVDGIRDLLVHGETGYLCGTSPADIRAAILDVCGDAVLAQRISAGAVDHIRCHHTLAIAVDREVALLASLAA